MTGDAAGAARTASFALLALLWVIAVVLFGHGHLVRVAPGGMIDVLAREFQVGAAALGNLSSMYWYAYAAALIPGGILLDRYPAGRVMAASVGVCALGGLVFALAPDLATANTGRFVAGLGSAPLFSGCIKLARDWFAPARFTLLSGVVVLFGMVGAAIGQAPLALLVERAGWHTVMLWVALVALPLAFVLWFAPRAAGADADADGKPVDFRTVLGMLGATARSRQVWIATLMAVSIGTPAISFALWTVGYYMQVHDRVRADAALFTSVAMLGWAAGSLLVGWVSGRIGRRKPPAVAGAALSLAGWSVFIAWPGLPEAAHFVLMFVLGLAAGGIVVSFALVAEHGPARAVGISTGLANTMVMSVSALVQIFMGVILDLHWEGEMRDGVRFYPAAGYRYAFLVMPVLGLVGIAASLAVRETRGRPGRHAPDP